MAEKIAIIVGEHPMTANAGKQYADSGYTVSVVDCLSELDTTSMPDEIFMATTSNGVDRFAEDIRNINEIKTLFCDKTIARRVRVHLLLHNPDTLVLMQKDRIPEDISDLIEIIPFTVESLWGQRLFFGLEDYQEKTESDQGKL